jgi:D-alanyl-D-alanine carboxypeptidase/D-alanyl-D-alanine-endopeptidase (penicillin-binding protein 4)
MRHLRSSIFIAIACLIIGVLAACAQNSNPRKNADVPSDIRAVFNKSMYKDSTWTLRLLASDGKVLIDYNSQQQMFIGSVRKVFTVGQLLNAIGPDHTFDTPIYRIGTVDSAGVLHGSCVGRSHHGRTH